PPPPRPNAPWSSNFETFGCLVFAQIVDLVRVVISQVLQVPFRPGDLVLADLAVLTQLVQGFLGLAAHTTNGDLGVLALALDRLDHLLAALLGQLWNHHANELSVIAGIHPQIGVTDGTLDGPELAEVIRFDDRHTSLRNVDARQLVEWRRHAVVLHRDAGEHRRCRSSGPYRGKVLLGNRHGLFHLVLGIEESVVDHGHSLILRESSDGGWGTYECPDPLTAHRTGNVALSEEIEHQDRHVVVHTQAESSRIGDSQPPLQNLTVRDNVEHFRARVAVGV